MSERMVSEARTVEELQDAFNNKFDSLDVCMGLLGLGGQEPLDHMQDIRQQLHSIRRDIEYFRSEVEKGKSYLEQAKQELSLLSALNARLNHIRDNLPARLPSVLQHQQLHRPKPDLSNIGITNTAANTAASICIQQESCSGKDVVKASARFQYITIDEFEEVPKYIRGRLQYEQVNKVVDDLNKALATKYSLMRKPRSKLSLVDMKLVNVLRSQNNADTKGRMFVCGEDLKRWCDIKVDTSTRTVLTILRTAKKCQEIRGPGSMIRYTVLV
uniref:SKA complex subunit 1 n=1 Tax=Hirondellea gigas TaxID=1518452 RepID=A0A6A7G5Q9_9CRUS